MTEEELCSKDPGICGLVTDEYPDRDSFINRLKECRQINGRAPMAERRILNYTVFPNQGQGLRRIDLFEALFNGNFDAGLSGWTTEGTGTADVLSFAGAGTHLVSRTARLTAGDGPGCYLSRTFPVRPGVGSLKISFDYNIVSPEDIFSDYGEYNDAISFDIQFYDRDGKSSGAQELLTVRADSDLLRYNLTDGFFSLVSSGGSGRTEMTGWKHHVSENISVPEAGGTGIFSISIRNVKDSFQNCSVLADNIRFESGSRVYHSADYDPDFRISLSELLRVIQLYNSGGYHCRLFTADNPATPDNPVTDGYAPESEEQENCTPHDSDYAPQDWHIDLSELMRLLQFYTLGGYRDGAGTEDGFAPVTVSGDPSDISISPGLDMSLNDGIPAGESVNIAFTVSFGKNDGKTYTVSVTQEIYDAGGTTYTIGSAKAPLSLTPDFGENWTADRPMKWILAETVKGIKAGVCGIKTTVKIDETGETAGATTIVNVIPSSR